MSVIEQSKQGSEIVFDERLVKKFTVKALKLMEKLQVISLGYIWRSNSLFDDCHVKYGFMVPKMDVNKLVNFLADSFKNKGFKVRKGLAYPKKNLLHVSDKQCEDLFIFHVFNEGGIGVFGVTKVKSIFRQGIFPLIYWLLLIFISVLAVMKFVPLPSEIFEVLKKFTLIFINLLPFLFILHFVLFKPLDNKRCKKHSFKVLSSLRAVYEGITGRRPIVEKFPFKPPRISWDEVKEMKEYLYNEK
ncbi:MAG: hypothetical protein B6U95_00170 [Thermofilum sp. ex4484_82]|nr:MAG: hypothetical protein B6U95_00170 [Thermofilum sp. ex4484_82]OYT40145.1 MAG: hypothetical protein B6U96_00170 [Archaeoglobales archaeon ex4484_92]